MSWQTYVDSNLVGTGKVTKAAIIGQKGGVWATSPGFNVSPDEQKHLANNFNSPTQAQANGIRVSGVKYFTLSADENSIYGKKSADGVVLVKTKQAILVAVYEPPIQQAEIVPVVESLGDYLRSVGY